MSAFLQKLNFARVMMLVALLFSAVLAYTGWNQYETLSELKQDLETRMPETAKGLEAAGRRHTQLAKNYDKEALKGEQNLMSYALKCATDDRVEIGEIDPQPSVDKNTGTKGIEDQKLDIKPKDPKRGYTRLRIANFLYRLEEQSRRVKVTDVEFTLAGPKTAKHEVPEDSWTFSCQITSRQRRD
ncbi:MAG: hypothetical protein IPJ77_22850 [Planctomycetes bacterium]|nr:hypothetical protein [Planctomycetota bacterium]